MFVWTLPSLEAAAAKLTWDRKALKNNVNSLTNDVAESLSRDSQFSKSGLTTVAGSHFWSRRVGPWSGSPGEVPGLVPDLGPGEVCPGLPALLRHGG